MSVMIGDDRIIFPFVFEMDNYDLGKAEVGQVEDMQEVIRMKSQEILQGEERDLTEIELIGITPYVVAIYIQKFMPYSKGEYSGSKAIKLVDRVKQEMSFKDVVSLGYFFFIRLTSYKNGLKKGLPIFHSLKRKFLRVWSNLIRRLEYMPR